MVAENKDINSTLSVQWEVQVAQDLQGKSLDVQRETPNADPSQPEGPSEAEAKAEAIMLDCLNNIVDVYMKAEEYEKAKQAASQVVARHPDNFAALLQIGKAAMMDQSMSSYDKAEMALNAADKAAQGDNEKLELEEARAELGRRRHQYKRKAKAMFRRMRKSIRSKD